jgi:hypothetical protein
MNIQGINGEHGVIFETYLQISVCINDHGVDVFINDLSIETIHNGETGEELIGEFGTNVEELYSDFVKSAIEEQFMTHARPQLSR